MMAMAPGYASPAMAEEAETEANTTAPQSETPEKTVPPKLWKARVELSYINTGGNTESETASGKFDFRHEARRDRYYFKAEALYRENNNEEETNRFASEVNWEHTVTRRFFTVITAGYLTDRYAGFNSRIYGGPGLGYDIVKSDAQHLKALISAIYYADDYTSINPGEDEYWTGKATLKYRLDISEDVTFKQAVDYTVKLSETEKYFLDSETALEAALNSYLSLGLNYVVNYRNGPPPGIRDTDRKFMATLIFTL